jgi:hypothetical protein
VQPETSKAETSRAQTTIAGTTGGLMEAIFIGTRQCV